MNHSTGVPSASSLEDLKQCTVNTHPKLYSNSELHDALVFFVHDTAEQGLLLAG